MGEGGLLIFPPPDGTSIRKFLKVRADPGEGNKARIATQSRPLGEDTPAGRDWGVPRRRAGQDGTAEPLASPPSGRCAAECPHGACTPSPREGPDGWSEPAREAAMTTKAAHRDTGEEVYLPGPSRPRTSSGRGEEDKMTVALSPSSSLSQGSNLSRRKNEIKRGGL